VSALVITAIVAGSIAGYVFFAALTVAVLVDGLRWDENGPGAVFVPMIWPASLPGILGYLAGRRLVLWRRSRANIPTAEVVGGGK